MLSKPIKAQNSLSSNPKSRAVCTPQVHEDLELTEDTEGQVSPLIKVTLVTCIALNG